MLPEPVDANGTAPGCFAASAASSFADRTGVSDLTTRMVLLRTTSATGSLQTSPLSKLSCWPYVARVVNNRKEVIQCRLQMNRGEHPRTTSHSKHKLVSCTNARKRSRPFPHIQSFCVPGASPGDCAR